MKESIILIKDINGIRHPIALSDLNECLVGENFMFFGMTLTEISELKRLYQTLTAKEKIDSEIINSIIIWHQSSVSLHGVGSDTKEPKKATPGARSAE